MILSRWISLLALCVALATPAIAAAQEPAPPEQPVVDPAPPEPEEEPTEEAIEEAKEMVQPVQEESRALDEGASAPERRTDTRTESAKTESEAPGGQKPVPEAWWHSGYFVDYALIGLGGAAFVVARFARPRVDPLFGADFDFTDPVDSINFQDERIDRLYVVRETIPTKHLAYMVPGVLTLLAAEEGIIWAFTERGSAQMYHDVLVGFVESVSLTLGATEMLKSLVGRLRPDFTNRALLMHCSENPNDALCEDINIPAGYSEEELDELFEDGRRSFPSGHASIGVNIYTYLALVIGGHYVWGDEANHVSRGLGIFFQTVAFGTGMFIATSRLDDGRHHDTDVFAGMLLGLGMANLAYWRRFGMDGLPLPRRIAKRSITWDLRPGPGTGIALHATF